MPLQRVSWPRRQTDVYNKLTATRRRNGEAGIVLRNQSLFRHRRNKLIPLTPAKHSFKRRLLFISRQFSRICRGNLVTASRGGKSCRVGVGGADMVNTSGKLIEGIGSACGRFLTKCHKCAYTGARRNCHTCARTSAQTRPRATVGACRLGAHPLSRPLALSLAAYKRAT